MHKSSSIYLIAEADLIVVYLKLYLLYCENITCPEETDETFIKCYLLLGFICGWNGPSSHHSFGFTWMNSPEDEAACKIKTLYNTTKMSYSYNFHGQDKCFNIFIKGDKLWNSRLFLFSPSWMERKTSSTRFNHVSLCIIVPKVAVFYFWAFCANIIQFLWPSQIFAAWLTLLNWAAVRAKEVCLASSTAQTRQ